MGTSKSAKARKHAVPTKTGEFTILPLTLPTQPGLPPACAEAKHYLYIRVHAPTNPTPDTDRSLFIANVPIDASESNIRRLFAEQLGGARVESVEFDSAIPAGPVRKQVREEVVAEKGKGRKRKRDEEVVAEGLVEDEESALPRIWPAPLRKSGSTAVVVFVDRESRRGALKEVQRVVKEGTEVRWLGGEKGVVGVERECQVSSTIAAQHPELRVGFAFPVCVLTAISRVQIPPCSPLPPTHATPRDYNRLSRAIRRSRTISRPSPRSLARRS